MTAKIQLIGVKKRFGPKVVLDGVDLTIDKQSSVVIIGGSGTGKSVTIKSILGIIRPDEGTILVDGEDVTYATGSARERMRRKFGMLFQGAALFDSLPVWENVAFGPDPGTWHGPGQGARCRHPEAGQGGPDRGCGVSLARRIVGRHAEARRPRPRHRGGSGDHLLRRAHHGA
jgi:ABC-type sugar transport system ATPase subunit